jgi:protein GON7
MSTPSASYHAPTASRQFITDIPVGELTTDGKTTGPSEFVLSKGAVDKDKPSEHKGTPMGLLRCRITHLQDDINEYLTKRMKEQEGNKEEQEFEKKLLDGGDSDEDGD